jgi:hypothetical protein
MSNITYWPSKTVVRSTLVVPTHGFGMGEVCPQAGSATASIGGFVAAPAMSKRHLDAVQATPFAGRQPWSPPVT